MTKPTIAQHLAAVAALDQARAANEALARTVAAQDQHIAELVLEQHALREVANAAVGAHLGEVERRMHAEAERERLAARVLRLEHRLCKRRSWWWL